MSLTAHLVYGLSAMISRQLIFLSSSGYIMLVIILKIYKLIRMLVMLLRMRFAYGTKKGKSHW